MMRTHRFPLRASQRLNSIRFPAKAAVQLLTRLLVFSLCLFPTVATAQSPHIYDVPQAGRPGSQTQALGNGFDPNATLDVYFDSTDVGVVFTDGHGAFGMALRAPTIRQNGLTIRIPGDAVPGQHWITAVERITQLQAQVAFTVRGHDWPQFHSDAQHTGFNPYENVLTPETVANLWVRWKYMFSDPLDNSPAVAYGIVYVSGYKLYAFDATTGALLWANPASPMVWGAPAVANGIIYLSGDDGYLYAMDATSGANVWQQQLSVGVGTAPTVVNGVVYVRYGNVYALDAGTGTILWKFVPPGGYGDSAPAVANGVVYFGADYDNSLYALDAGTGTFLWKFTTGDWVDSSPAVANGVAYIGSDDGNLYALNAATGALLWKYTTGGKIESTPAVANGVAYIGSWDNNLYALDAGTGVLLWKYTSGGIVVSSPALANGVVYVGSNDKNVYALDATTGALLWKHTTQGAISHSSPAVADGMIYIRSGDQNVYAFGLPNQQMSETFGPPQRPDQALLTPDWSTQPNREATPPLKK